MFNYELHKQLTEQRDYFKALSEHRKGELKTQKEYAAEKKSIEAGNAVHEKLKADKRLELKNEAMEQFKASNPYATSEELRKQWDEVDSKADYEAEAHDYTGNESFNEAIKGAAAEVDAVYADRFKAEDAKLEWAMQQLDAGQPVDELAFKQYTPPSE